MGLTDEMYLERLRRIKEGEYIGDLGVSAFAVGVLRAMDNHIEDLRERIKQLEEEVDDGEVEGETSEGGGSS